MLGMEDQFEVVGADSRIDLNQKLRVARKEGWYPTGELQVTYHHQTQNMHYNMVMMRQVRIEE